MRTLLLSALGLSVVLSGTACGGAEITGPAVEVTLGETSLVVLVNPIVNEANQAQLAAPGSMRSQLNVSWAGGTSVLTDASGLAVLGGVAAGPNVLSLTGSGMAGAVSASIAQQDLHEIVVALTNTGATVMADVRYAFGGELVEITPSMPVADVNAQLARSNVIVLMGGGTYQGNLAFSGSNVTLFGAGTLGGEVTIEGDVTIDGSNNRLRGARISGNLSVPGSNAGISFSRVSGDFEFSGSSAVLLNNVFCSQVTMTGSNPTLLGNAGLAPIPASSGGC